MNIGLSEEKDLLDINILLKKSLIEIYKIDMIMNIW